MTSGRPAATHLHVKVVLRLPDEYLAVDTLRLRMATETQIAVRLPQHRAIDGTVGAVARGAAFADCRVLEHEGSCLFAMTLGAAFILPRHGQSAAGGLKNIAAVRVVALRTVHVAFDDGMMRRQLKFRARLRVASETGLRFVHGIDDEFSAAAAGFNMPAAGAVARFATGAALQRGIGKIQPRMRTGLKFPDNVGVTIVADLVADVVCAGDFQRLDNDTRRERGTRNAHDGNANARRDRNGPFLIWLHSDFNSPHSQHSSWRQL